MHRTNITRQDRLGDVVQHHSEAGTWVTQLTDGRFTVTEHFGPDSKKVVYDSNQRAAESRAAPPRPLRPDYLAGYADAITWVAARVEEDLIALRTAYLEKYGPAPSAIGGGSRYQALALDFEELLTEVGVLSSTLHDELIAIRRKLLKAEAGQ